MRGISTFRSWKIRLLVSGLLLAANILATAATGTVAVGAASGEVATAERPSPDLLSSPSIARTGYGRLAAADHIIVGFQAGVSDAEKEAVHRAIRPASVKQISTAVEYVGTTGAQSLDDLVASYRADPHVRYAEPDYLVHALDLPNDQYFGNQYGMSKIQAPAAWAVTHGSGDLRVAILDCGIYEAHPDLAGKVVARQDFTGSASGTDDRCDHGTHVAGIASAETNNKTGVAGLGYNTKLLNGKVLDDGGSGYDAQIADGIRWAADNGAKVINMSLGGYGACSQTFQDAIDYAWSKNVVIVAAAGNGGGQSSMQPADCAHVIAVASTDANDARSSFSNFGSWVALSAPGSAIYSTVNPNLPANTGNAYAYLSGTSMATPLVAGLAALLWSTAWGTSAQAVVQRMESTADHIAGTGTNWQYGRINAMAAVAPTIPPPQPTGMTPATGPTTGGGTARISGSAFQSGARVTFDGVAVPTLSVMSTEITLTVPAHAAGKVNVIVANPDGQSQRVPGGFGYTGGMPTSRPGPAAPGPTPAVPPARPGPTPSPVTAGAPAPPVAPVPVPPVR